MSDTDDATEPLIRRGDDIEYESVDAADGLAKGVLIGEAQGAPNLAIRRFTLAPGGEVPKHTNAIEHEQYVLQGEYTVGIREASETPLADGEAVDADEEYQVAAGDSLHIPAGAVHWYRNEGDAEGAFLCAVPTGDDEIRLVEE
ncbi:cupin domain-containing protein [Halorientalis halophila]|uniref:cupin domain-containing protein n=1 Tax=Halorientalis halophila TaxID=3108499 RepID=UPI00300BCC7A